MMKSTYILCAFLLLSCTRTTQVEKMRFDVLDFLNDKRFRFSTNKLDIPSVVIDSLSRFNGAPFEIGDRTNEGQISLSDARLFEEDAKVGYVYSRKLHFVLVSNDICLISYTEGGVGTHDVVDYVHFKGNYKHVRYASTEVLNDTVKLGAFLRRYYARLE